MHSEKRPVEGQTSETDALRAPKLADGHMSRYGDDQLAGQIALLGGGEYVQAERSSGRVTLMWTVSVSAEDAVAAFGDLVGEPSLVDRGFVTFDRPADHREISARKVFQLASAASDSVRVFSVNHEGLRLAWRSAVKKLPDGAPRNECAVTFDGGHVSSLASLLERTGTDYVVKVANEVLADLDLLDPVR